MATKQAIETETVVAQEPENTSLITNDTVDAGLSIFAVAERPFYSSFPLVTEDDQVTMVNAMQATDYKLSSFINMPLTIKHVMAFEVELIDKATGEVHTAQRAIIMDEEGKTYSATSKGIMGSLANIVRAKGDPKTWKEGVPVTVKQQPCEKGSVLIFMLRKR